MRLNKFLTILCFLSIIILCSCEEDNNDSPIIEITGPPTFAEINGIDESVVGKIVNALITDSEYIRVTPILADSKNSQFHFIFGVKDYKPWLNVYDSDWRLINKHLFPNQIENRYHIGYGEYGELCDIFLSHIHYSDNAKFLEIYIVYKITDKYEPKYAIRCQSIFIDNNDFFVVNDSNISDYPYNYHLSGVHIEEYSQYDSFTYNTLPYTIESLRKPWINNSFLHIYISRLNKTGGHQCICYNLANFSVIYKSTKEYSNLTSFEIENAINYEEVIIIDGTKSPEIERYNINTGDTKWSINIKNTDLIPSDAKFVSLNVVERLDNIWILVGEWILYDGTHKKLKLEVNIETGEYFIDDTYI